MTTTIAINHGYVCGGELCQQMCEGGVVVLRVRCWNCGKIVAAVEMTVVVKLVEL